MFASCVHTQSKAEKGDAFYREGAPTQLVEYRMRPRWHTGLGGGRGSLHQLPLSRFC